MWVSTLKQYTEHWTVLRTSLAKGLEKKCSLILTFCLLFKVLVIDIIVVIVYERLIFLIFLSTAEIVCRHKPRNLASNRGPASISTTCLDPRPVFEDLPYLESLTSSSTQGPNENYTAHNNTDGQTTTHEWILNTHSTLNAQVTYKCKQILGSVADKLSNRRTEYQSIKQ